MEKNSGNTFSSSSFLSSSTSSSPSTITIPCPDYGNGLLNKPSLCFYLCPPVDNPSHSNQSISFLKSITKITWLPCSKWPNSCALPFFPTSSPTTLSLVHFTLVTLALNKSSSFSPLDHCTYSVLCLKAFFTDLCMTCSLTQMLSKIMYESMLMSIKIPTYSTFFSSQH